MSIRQYIKINMTFNMKDTLKHLFLVLLAVVMTVPMISGTSLYAQQEPQEPSDPEDTRVSAPLTYKEAILARIDDNNRMVTVSDPVFRRGENVYLVLRRVGVFTAGSDGKHRMDLDMLVTGPNGETVLDERGLLGEKGHALLEGGIAQSPNGIFKTFVGLTPGKYRMTVTIRDVVSKASVAVTKELQLEAGLGYQKAVFARKGSNNETLPAEDGVFQRGETVQLVVFNAGKFKLGADGKHFFELDMVVTNPSGSIVFQQRDMLKGAGHKVLDKGIASSPYGMFFSNIEMDSGIYQFKISLRDKVSGQTLHVVRQFTLK